MFKRGLAFTVCAGLVGCGACLAIIGGIVFLVLGLTKPVVDASDAFLNDVKAGNYAAAYDKCSPSLQTELGGVENLQTMFEGLGEIDDWSYSNRSIENNTGEVSGTMTFTDDSESDLILTLEKVDDEWKISSFEITPKTAE